jgi:hypothetical protein
MRKLLSFLALLPLGLVAQNVGIGTTTPAARLDVKTTSQYVSQFNGAAPMYMGIFGVLMPAMPKMWILVPAVATLLVNYILPYRPIPG